jgi:type VI secretion system protein ImpF
VTQSDTSRAHRACAPTRRDSRSAAPPSLLDRLSGDIVLDASHALFPAHARLRESVLQNLDWLMNSTSLEVTDDLDAFPHVRESVVNFGICSLAGTRISEMDWAGIESGLRKAIVRFEPRIVADSVDVRCIAQASRRNALGVEITGQLRGGHTVQAFLFRSDIDLENGDAALRAEGAT